MFDDKINNVIRNQDEKQNLPSVSEILKSKDNKGLQKFNALTIKQQLSIVLDASGKDRVELLYMSHRFISLVQAMPAPEVLFTYEEVGMDIALPIIAATSHEQFTFLTDILCWDKDKINPHAIGEWFQILAECGEDKIQEWLANVDHEWFILILKNLVNIYKCDEEGNAPDIPQANNLYTIDGMYYFEFLDSNSIDALQTILLILRDEDPDGFRGIMEATIWAETSEMEMYASYFRQNRISEWGFPELDESIEIYQYFTPAERKKVVQELEKGLSEWAEINTVPIYPVKLKSQKDFLATCLAYVKDDRRTARFSQELLLLTNKIQVADGMENFGALENIRLSSKKAMGYVALGLAEFSDCDPLKAAELIGRVHTERLFQVGFSQVQDLAQTAHRLVKNNWLAKSPYTINQLGSPDREILQGLLKSQPKYYVGDQTLKFDDYQDFSEPEQVMKCWEVLKRIE